MAVVKKTARTTTVTFTEKAIADELGRRRKNKTRQNKVRAKAWYYTEFQKPDFKALLAGEKVTKTTSKGKKIHATLAR